MITNIQNQQNIAAWKKNYSVFSQAATKIINDYNINNLQDFCTNTISRQECRDYFIKYISYVKTCDDWGSRDCFPAGSVFLNGNDSDYMIYGIGAILSDGAMFDLNYTGVPLNTVRFIVDINGFKKPNMFGKDIYAFHLTPTGISPDGAGASSFNCPDAGSGGDCSAYYLLN